MIFGFVLLCTSGSIPINDYFSRHSLIKYHSIGIPIDIEIPSLYHLFLLRRSEVLEHVVRLKQLPRQTKATP